MDWLMQSLEKWYFERDDRSGVYTITAKDFVERPNENLSRMQGQQIGCSCDMTSV
jgi:hypothetical protein